MLNKAASKIKDKISWTIAKIEHKVQSIPAWVPTAAILLLATYSIYYAVFELIPAIHNFYHNHVPNPNTRHLFFRAAPEVEAMTLGVSAMLYLFVHDGKLKEYKYLSIPGLFGRFILGLIVTIPASVGVYWLIRLWNWHWKQIHQFFAGHSPTVHMHAIHISVDQSTQSSLLSVLTTDAQKKLIVFAGILIANILVMKPFYYTVQRWFAERNIINHEGHAVYHWYLHIIPAYGDMLKYLDDRQYSTLNPPDLHYKYHRQRHEVYMWVTITTILMACGGGIYIAIAIAHGS